MWASLNLREIILNSQKLMTRGILDPRHTRVPNRLAGVSNFFPPWNASVADEEREAVSGRKRF